VSNKLKFRTLRQSLTGSIAIIGLVFYSARNFVETHSNFIINGHLADFSLKVGIVVIGKLLIASSDLRF
jgi:hypothetical protein